MTPLIRTTSQASIELAEAIRWYESKRRGLGGELLDRVRPDDIVVVALAHLKRRPGYWKNRV